MNKIPTGYAIRTWSEPAVSAREYAGDLARIAQLHDSTELEAAAQLAAKLAEYVQAECEAIDRAWDQARRKASKAKSVA